jgi:hypothetical protein
MSKHLRSQDEQTPQANPDDVALELWAGLPSFEI